MNYLISHLLSHSYHHWWGFFCHYYKNCDSFYPFIMNWSLIYTYDFQTAANLKVYYATCFSLIAGIILFGGLLAPTVSAFATSCFFKIVFVLSNIVFTCNLWQLELKLGIGGTSYADFIQSLHLPMQLRFNTCFLQLWFIALSLRFSYNIYWKDA